MTSPPAGMTADFERWLAFDQIAREVAARRPDLADRVERNDGDLHVVVDTELAAA